MPWFQLPPGNPGGGDGGGSDVPGEGGSCGWPYRPEHYDPCVLSPVGPELDLNMIGLYQYNTVTGVLTDPLFQMTIPPSTNGAVRLLYTSKLTIAMTATLRVTGSKPLLVISDSTITVDGGVDASSRFDGTEFSPGAGADPTDCPASPPEVGETCSTEGGSGGGAGAFGGAGGAGGEGADTHDCGGLDGLPGGAGGMALPSIALRGGCGGRNGAPSLLAGSDQKIGKGGPGGGAVYLSARNLVTVAGVVHAGGAGGRGSAGGRAGGGGGGSGGMIGLEGVTVTAAGIIAANGGGGGGGADGNVADPGEDGQASATVAAGGAGEGMGSDGGNGGYADVPDGLPAARSKRGGGGGGGGAGVIHFHGTGLNTDSATITPNPTP